MDSSTNIKKLFQDSENVSEVQLNTSNLIYNDHLTDNCASIFLINNFQLLFKELDHLKISSTWFRMNKMKQLSFQLQLYHTKGSNYLSLDVSFYICPQKFKGSYNLWLIDKNEEKFKIDFQEIYCEKGEWPTFKTTEFLEISKVKNPNSKWLTQGTLKILITMDLTFEHGKVSCNNSDEKKVTLHNVFNEQKNFEVAEQSNHENDENKISLKNDTDANYFEKLYDNRLFSDFTLIVDEKELKVHKSLLSIASPVFLEIFQRQTEESSSVNSTVISDFSFETINEMIRFIYTNKIDNINEVAHELIVAASKYGVNELKNVCENYLCQNLDVGNVLKLIVIANGCNAEKLVKSSLEIISTNRVEFKDNPELESVILSYPNLRKLILNELVSLNVILIKT